MSAIIRFLIVVVLLTCVGNEAQASRRGVNYLLNIEGHYIQHQYRLNDVEVYENRGKGRFQLEMPVIEWLQSGDNEFSIVLWPEGGENGTTAFRQDAFVKVTLQYFNWGGNREEFNLPLFTVTIGPDGQPVVEEPKPRAIMNLSAGAVRIEADERPGRYVLRIPFAVDDTFPPHTWANGTIIENTPEAQAKVMALFKEKMDRMLKKFEYPDSLKLDYSRSEFTIEAYGKLATFSPSPLYYVNPNGYFIRYPLFAIRKLDGSFSPVFHMQK